MKETISKVKRQPSEWGENNSKGSNWQLIPKIHRQLMQFNSRNPVKMWAKELNRHFSKEDTQMANKDMKRSSASLKCKSKPQWGITSQWSEWPPSKSLQAINAGEGAEKREPSHTVGENANWESHYGDSVEIPLRLETELPYDPATPCWACTPRKPELRETRAPPCSSQHWSQQPGRGGSLDVHWQTSGWGGCGTYTQWNTTQL